MWQGDHVKYQPIQKRPFPAPPSPPPAPTLTFHWGFPPYSGEFDPKWGPPSRIFDFHVKTLASVPLKKPIKKWAFWKEQFYWNKQTSKTLDILVVFSTMFTFK